MIKHERSVISIHICVGLIKINLCIRLTSYNVLFRKWLLEVYSGCTCAVYGTYAGQGTPVGVAWEGWEAWKPRGHSHTSVPPTPWVFKLLLHLRNCLFLTDLLNFQINPFPKDILMRLAAYRFKLEKPTLLSWAPSFFWIHCLLIYV